MHAFFATRGIKREVDELVKWLETRTFFPPEKQADGQIMFRPICGNLQPIQLWSYVFPEEAKDVVLTTLKFDEENRQRWAGNFKMKAAVESMRLMMGAKCIPAFKGDKKLHMPVMALENVSIIPIGVKYDAKNLTETDGAVHEAL